MFYFFTHNIFINRIFAIKKAIIFYSFSSLLDIFLIISISSIFQEISSDNFSGDLSLFIMLCILLISFRTIIVFLLRKYSLKNIFSKKVKDENNILDQFINNRVNEFNNDNNKSLNEFKEKLINSCNLAVINFDIPIISIFAEIIFSIGGIFLLLRIFGYKLLLFNLPAFLILSIFSRYISRKLKNLGKLILDLTEKRLNIIDNISEIAIEVSTLKYNENLNKYFYKLNKPYNDILRKQIIYSNMLQISTESTAFIIILISLVCLITNVTQTSLANSATSLAVLTRMVPSFTRTIAFITQLQFGLPCIRRLSKMINE